MPELTRAQCLASLVECLEAVPENRAPHLGICATMDEMFREHRRARGVWSGEYYEDPVEDCWEDEKEEAFAAWDEFSGHPVAPVPSELNTRSPLERYLRAVDADEMWLGEYGARRERLLQHLIEYFKLQYREETNEN